MSSKLMTEAHKHTITKNRSDLLKNLTVTETLLNILSEDYSLTAELREEIENQGTRQGKVSTLLDTITRRPDKAFDRFVYALVQTGNDHLAEVLDTSAATRYLASRQHVRHSTDSHSAASTPSAISQSMQWSQVNAPTGIMTPGAMPYPYPYPMMMMPPHMYPSSSPIPGYPMATVGFNPYLNQFVPPWPNASAMIAASTKELSTPVEEIDKSVAEQQDKLVADFKAVIENGSPIMNFDVTPVTNGDASRVINSKTEISYNMTQRVRGRAVIVSNQFFVSNMHKMREGAEFDEENVKALFTKLGFETVVYANKGREELLNLLNAERQTKCVKNHDAFVLFVLSHGNSGCIFTSDGEKVMIEHITTLFDGKSCPALDGKPKLFFIQACQGTKKSSAYDTDGPTNIQESQEDSIPVTQPLSAVNGDDTNLARKLAEMALEDKPGYVPELPPITDTQHHKADMLISYATVKGYEAWRHSELGSWFVRSLVYVLSREAHSSDLISILTKVNYLMSHLRTQGTRLPYRQVAEKRDTFLKKLYFLPNYVSE